MDLHFPVTEAFRGMKLFAKQKQIDQCWQSGQLKVAKSSEVTITTSCKSHSTSNRPFSYVKKVFNDWSMLPFNIFIGSKASEIDFFNMGTSVIGWAKEEDEVMFFWIRADLSDSFNSFAF